MDDYNEAAYGGDESTADMMWTDYDYHVNTGELDDWFPDEPSPNDYADWD